MVSFIVWSFLLVHRNGGTDFWKVGWAVAAIWTLYKEITSGGLRQGEERPSTAIILKIGHTLLEIIGKVDKLERANICSHTRFSSGQEYFT